MTKQPLPRFRADIQVVIDLSAFSADDAERRLVAIASEIEKRLGRSTFQRLSGKPEVVFAAVSGEPVAV